MAGTFPSTTGFTTLNLTSNTNTRVTISASGKSQRLKTGEQSWSFTLKSPKKSRADVMVDYAFLVSQDGQAETFTVVPPTISNTRGTATGTMTVDNAEVVETEVGGIALSKSAGSNAVGITNSSETGNLKKGDLIKFSNHDKVYMLTADIDLDGSSVNALQFHPPLTTAVTSSTTVTYNNVPFKVYLASDAVSVRTTADEMYEYEIRVNEEI